MSTANRIVLLSCEGDELFSGSSLFLEPPPSTLPAALQLAPRRHVEPIVEEKLAERSQEDARNDRDEDDEEPVPETLRSSVFVRTHEPVSRPIVIEMDEDHRAA